ncbi:hypothetical protein LCGC14_1605190 [marine sediment metagenome]|uniref:Uncharacterized protein n=1 Tax=marine sediment metagenome TaxID=412755 RepID=A0A0F9I9Z2_9ZZZZ
MTKREAKICALKIMSGALQKERMAWTDIAEMETSHLGYGENQKVQDELFGLQARLTYRIKKLEYKTKYKKI